MARTYDFCGWATKNDLKCSDGRIIRKDAFKECDGATVPLVWNHQHSEAYNVLGHAELENRPEGVYAYGSFNDSESGRQAKELVKHGDITSLSIYANQLKQVGHDVIHGAIREVSLVLAGANKGATIDTFFEHSEDDDDDFENEAVICTGDDISLYHAEEPEVKEESKKEEDSKVSDTKEKTIKDVFDTFNDEQKNVVYAMIAAALNEDEEDENADTSADANDKGGNVEMSHNVFENDNKENTLSHDAMNKIIADGKRFGSLKESFLAHASDYGIDQIDWLFPEAQPLENTPDFIKREMGWVPKVMNAVHHTPFSRIKSMFANITEDEARAKGYIKGNMKKEEVFTLLKRTTTPTTIYKKQKLDRDDVIDITDFDVVSWLKSEMRMMLDEEIARAILIGDGRLSSSDDKISEDHIRPIVSDDDLYTIKKTIELASGATDDDAAKAFIRAAIKARKDYRGSGEPTLYTYEDVLTNCLLMEDQMGRVIYDTPEKLKNVLRVKDIVIVPVMEGYTNSNGASLMGVIVNLSDYNVGADKGGAVNMFDDFDIDYNQQKYLIETRCSGALIKPYSAIALYSSTISK
jgi:HK97 family phage prohead protease/HK97 family phage major capsid protein